MQDISYYYRCPFYVVRNDLKKINGLFVFLPENLYDKTFAALMKEDDNAISDLFGPRWKEILMPDLSLFLSGGDKLNGPLEIDHDRYFYEPSWSCAEVKHYYITEHIALIGMGILKSDNFVTLRLKIMATLGVSVFAQSLSTPDISDDILPDIDLGENSDGATDGPTIRDLKKSRMEKIKKTPWIGNVSDSILKLLDGEYRDRKIISDIIIDGGELVLSTILNPFDKSTHPGINSQISENVSATPSCFVYLLKLTDYTAMMEEEGFVVGFMRDILALFPWQTQKIYQLMMGDPNYIHTSMAFKYTPKKEFSIQSTRDISLQNEILFDSESISKTKLTEVIALLMFSFKKLVPVGGINILKSVGTISDKVDYIETNNIQNNKEILSDSGTAVKKSIDLVEKTKPKLIRGFEWIFSAFSKHRQLLGFVFADQFGNSKLTFKFNGIEISPHNAITEIKKTVADKYPKDILDGSDLTFCNISSLSIGFYLEKVIPMGSFEKCKNIVIHLSTTFAFEVFETNRSYVAIRFPYMMLNEKDNSKELNTFARWSSTIVQKSQSNQSVYKYVEIEMIDMHTLIKFNCPNIPWTSLAMVKRVILYIGAEIEMADLKPIVDQKRGEQRVNNTKELGARDRKRFKFTAKTGNYSQRCQSADQPILLPKEQYDSLSKDDLKRTIVLSNMTTGGLMYLICPVTRPHGIFMINVHPKLHIDPETGDEYYICMPCCRKSEPKSNVKLKINNICKEHGLYPVKGVMPIKRVNHILQWTMRNYVDRIMNMYPLFASIINSNKYFVYGPQKDSTTNGMFVNAILKIMHRSLQQLNEEIINYLLADPSTIGALSINCNIRKDQLQDMLIRGTLLFDLNVTVDSVSDLIVIYTYLLENFYDIHVFVFGDEIVCNVSRYSIPMDSQICMIYQHKNAFFPIIYLQHESYSGNLRQLEFMRTPYDTLFQTMKSILERSHRERLIRAAGVIEKISAVGQILWFYRNINKAIYGVEVIYSGSQFYVPIPISSNNDGNITTSSPSKFPSIKIITRFLGDIGETADAICSHKSAIFAFRIFNSFMFISETDLIITDAIKKNSNVIEYDFDYRNITDLLGDNTNTDSPVVDEETYHVGRSEVGKQTTFQFYSLLVCRALVMTNKSPERIWIKKVLDKDVDVLHTIFMASNLTSKTKKAISNAYTGGFSIDNIVLQEDFTYYSKFTADEMTKILTDLSKKMVEIVPDDSNRFEELVDRDCFSNEKIILTSSMVVDYPKILAQLLVYKSVGDLIPGTIRNIFDITSNARPNKQIIKTIEHVRAGFSR